METTAEYVCPAGLWLGARVRCASLIALFALAGCGHDSALDAKSNACVMGQTAACVCADGNPSFQRCESDGAYSDCQCAGETPVSGGPSASALDAGSVGTGASGASGAPATGGSGGPVTGTGGTSVTVTPTAGTGAAGSGGSAANAGSGGSAGNAGAAGSAGTTAGSGGSAGSTAGTGGAGLPGMIGGPYARCTADGLCRDGLLCVDTRQSMAGGMSANGYCAPECVTHDNGSVSDCPQPTSGDVEAICIPIASLCVLTPCGESACPRGMECVERSSGGPGNQQGSCSYPAR